MLNERKNCIFCHCIDTEGPLCESLKAKFQRVKDIFNIDIKPSIGNLRKLKKQKNSSKWKRKKNRKCIVRSFNKLQS